MEMSQFLVAEHFRNMCIRYNSEIVTVQSIVQAQPLGLLYLIQNEFKNTALPEPKRLQDITKDVIPWLVAVCTKCCN